MRKRATVFAIASVLALVLAVHAWFPQTAGASGQIQYKAVPIERPGTAAIQEALDQYGAQGWELVAVEATQGHLIFKK